MAKLALTKLGLAQNKTIKTINYNGQEIEIKQYLPTTEKLELIANVLNAVMDDKHFVNPMKVSVYSVIEIIENYTNISFTAKQKEDPCKLYDLLAGNNVSSLILKAIPENELAELLTAIDDTISSVYAEKNSIFGILEAINQDYSNINFDMSHIQEVLQDKDSVGFLQELMPLINGKSEV